MKALVTSGPTFEPIDPVRFIGNRSSGKQGHAIAAALHAAGFEVTLVSGPVRLADPAGVRVVRAATAKDMLHACLAALPVDVAVCAAAVGDWQVASPAIQKIKKDSGAPLTLTLTENPDILHTLSTHLSARPSLVVGFAAETEQVLENALAKRAKKKCDWMLANYVSSHAGFDADENQVSLIGKGPAEHWPKMSKQNIASRLVLEIGDYLGRY